jgi:hypothetical protein
MSEKSTQNVVESSGIVKILSGVGDANTKFVLTDETGTHEYWGPVFSSRQRQGDLHGTPYWIDQIFVSADLNLNADEAFKAAYAAAQAGLKNDHPWHTLDSSQCGLAATLHMVGAAQPVQIEVTRMVTDADNPLDNKPRVNAVRAWQRQNMMTSFEVAEFDATSKMVCRAMGVVGPAVKDPDTLRSRKA